MIAEALAGIGQEIFNASILLVAVVMLIWHNVWMASHGRELAGQVKQVGEAVRAGRRSIVALGVVCAVAVMREGSEIALFMYGLAASARIDVGRAFDRLGPRSRRGRRRDGAHLSRAGDDPGAPALRRDHALDQLPRRGPRRAGRPLPAAGRHPAFLEGTAWDTSPILSDTSLIGRILHTLIGYSDQPSVLQVVVYLATLATIAALTKAFGPRRAPPRKALGAAAAE